MKPLIEKALKVSDAVEVYERRVFSTSVSMLMGELNGIEGEKKTEISLRIIKDGKMGAAIATDIEDESLIDRALISLEHQGKSAEPFEVHEPAQVLCYSELVSELSTEDLVHQVQVLNDRVQRLDANVKFGIEVNKTLSEIHMENSSGFNGSYKKSIYDLGVFTLNEKGFYNASIEKTGCDFSDITDEELKGLLEKHHLEAQPVSLENEKLPVILSGSVMGAMMLRVLGGVNGGNVIKHISPVENKLGEKVFSENITIRDDATHAYGTNTMAFDDEGTTAQNTLIYENGILKNYLLSQSHAKKLNGKPTGNAIKRALFSKEIEDAPTVFETNLIVEGNSIPDEALIKGIKRGLLITGVMGAHTGNIIQGEFSLNVSSGFLIEEGKLVGKVKGAMIAGNIYDMFKDIEAIGTALEPMRGIFYHMGYSPMVKFGGVNIVGK